MQILPESQTINIDDALNFQTLFDAQVNRSPDAIALMCGEESLSYQELNQQVNQLAHYLQSQGVKPESLAGICIDRSIHMIVGILGILKSGGAYIPLDPNYPRHRLEYILEDARAEIVVTQEELLDLFAEETLQPVCVDQDWAEIQKMPNTSPTETASADNLAYVIYTSGSTGKPKGVMITHANICHFARIASSALDITPDDIYLHSASIAYALSVRQLLIPLLVGATLVIATADQVRDPLLMFELIKQENITLIDVVPSFWRTSIQRLSSLPASELEELLDNSLRRIVSVGEPLIADIPEDWRFKLGHQADLVNIFGQTETTGVVATYPIPRDSIHKGTVPIGKSVADTKIYILDPDLQQVPTGDLGELCISSPCIARGYLNRPEVTAGKFIKNPFNDGFGEFLYRTGDLARVNESGDIQFLGREDDQVKIRGQRLELGEVEAILSQHPKVNSCIAVAHDEQLDEKQLIAFIIPTSETVTAKELRRFLSKRTPYYMIPTAFIFMDSWPLTPNGKINRLALSDPEFIASKLNHIHPPSDENQITITPQPKDENELVNSLKVIWQEILEINQVSIQDDFFELGGHSLSAVRMFSRIEQLVGVRLSSAVLIQASTIAKLSEKILEFQNISDSQVLIPIQPNGKYPTFFCIHGVGGGVFGYRDLINEMEEQHPVYGLQAIGLENHETCDKSIEVMASRYIRAIRAIQPNGPYFLGGYCFGGVVAYEMACQLDNMGERISLLSIFEGFIPNFKGTNSSINNRLKFFLKSIPNWIRDYASMPPNELRHRIRLTLSKILGKFSYNPELDRRVKVEEILNTESDLIPDRAFELTQVHSKALHSYKPRKYNGKVTLFRARNQSFNNVVFGSLDPTMGWGDLALGGVEVRLVNGFHRNIHLYPYVKSLASELNNCIESEAENER